MSGTILIGKHTLLLTILIIASTSQSTDQNYLHLIQSSHENVGVLSTVEHGTGQKMFPVVRKLLEAPEREDTKQVNSLNVRGVITGHPEKLFYLIQHGLEGILSNLTGIGVDDIRIEDIINVPLSMELLENPLVNQDGAILVEMGMFESKIATDMGLIAQKQIEGAFEVVIQEGIRLHHKSQLLQVLVDICRDPSDHSVPLLKPKSYNTPAPTGFAHLAPNQHQGSIWRKLLAWIALGGVLALSILMMRMLLEVLKDINEMQKKHGDGNPPTRIQTWDEPGNMGMNNDILFASDSPKLYHTQPKHRPVIPV